LKRLYRENKLSPENLKSENNKKDAMLSNLHRILEEKIPFQKFNPKNEYTKDKLNDLKSNHFFRLYFFKYDLNKLNHNLTHNNISNTALKGTRVLVPETHKYVLRKDLLYKFID
jgi:hypothetical protein